MSSSATTASRTGRAWKATAATGVAIALLAAGGATFAEWADSTTMNTGATITAGTMKFNANVDGIWTNVQGTNVTAKLRNGEYRIVPGDSLTYREDITIAASGDLLTATLEATVPQLAGDAALLGQLSENATMTLDGDPVEDFTASVVATGTDQALAVELTFVFDADTEKLLAQGQSVNLGALDVTLKQEAVTTDA